MYQHKSFSATCLLLASVNAFAAPPLTQWKIDPKNSSCTFTATQNNAPVSGDFKDIQGQISFSPDNPEENHAKIIINMTSASTSYKELSDVLKTSPDWFNVKLFPQAYFTSNKFIKSGDKNYQVEGNLTIRDKTIPVTLPFTIDDTSKDKMQIHGSATLDRSAFGVGQGDWADAKEVKNEVKIEYKLVLNPL